MKFFSTEGGFYKFISRFWDIVKLNFLWLICSLPIITIGVSTIAAYTITLKMIENKEGYVARGFFKAFKANFRQGMAIGPISILFFVAVFLDFNLSDHIAFTMVGILSAFLFFIALIYAYPLLARYSNTVFKSMRNSMRISMRYFGKTVLLAVFIVLELLIFRLTQITLIIGFLVGPACIFMTISGFAMYFFKEIEREGGVVPETKTEEDLYNEEIERETEEALKKENLR